LVVDPREPAARELLDARHVDVAVVQVRVETRHVLREERTVGADRVARERRGAALGDELEDVLEHLVLGLGEAHAVRDLVQQPGGRVHLAHEVAHVLEGRGVGLDDDAETGVDRLERVVGDDDRDLDELIDLEIETGHLAVDPYEAIRCLTHGFTLAGEVDAPVSWLRSAAGASRNQRYGGFETRAAFGDSLLSHLSGVEATEASRRVPPSATGSSAT